MVSLFGLSAVFLRLHSSAMAEHTIAIARGITDFMIDGVIRDIDEVINLNVSTYIIRNNHALFSN
jgi:regulator of RNase E activity RraA